MWCFPLPPPSRFFQVWMKWHFLGSNSPCIWLICLGCCIFSAAFPLIILLSWTVSRLKELNGPNRNLQKPVQFSSLNWLAQDEKGITAESKEGWGFLFRVWGDELTLSWNFIHRPWIDHCCMRMYAAWLVNLHPWKLLLGCYNWFTYC